jgi:hypothetical protein
MVLIIRMWILNVLCHQNASTLREVTHTAWLTDWLLVEDRNHISISSIFTLSSTDTPRLTQQLRSGRSGTSQILGKSDMSIYIVKYTCIHKQVLLKSEIKFTGTWLTEAPLLHCLSSPSSILLPLWSHCDSMLQEKIQHISKMLLLEFHLLFKNCMSQTALLQAAFKLGSTCSV